MEKQYLDKQGLIVLWNKIKSLFNSENIVSALGFNPADIYNTSHALVAVNDCNVPHTQAANSGTYLRAFSIGATHSPSVEDDGIIVGVRATEEWGTQVAIFASSMKVRQLIEGTWSEWKDVVNLPLANSETMGIAKFGTGLYIREDGEVIANYAVEEEIDARHEETLLKTDKLDYAVKAAMCDGVGADWTDDEKAAARDRIGIEDYINSLNGEEVSY